MEWDRSGGALASDDGNGLGDLTKESFELGLEVGWRGVIAAAVHSPPL